MSDVYWQRAKAVYWDDATPACRARNHSAECVLQPGHLGLHYGNGFDSYGPKAPYHWS